MLSKTVQQLDEITTRLEALAARLDRHDGVTVEQHVSPAVAAVILEAADECLGTIFGPIDAALIAGERDQAHLGRLAAAPLIRALGAAPPAQQTAAARTALWNMLSLLVARLAALRAGGVGPAAPERAS